MLISAEYADLNRQLHESNAQYGAMGDRHFKTVASVCDRLGTRDVLDYGCGKGKLVEKLNASGYMAYGYDPALAQFSRRPDPADVVVCADVLEHIEPENVDEVIADIRALTKIAAFFSVSTREAKKFLADGRNAHLVVKPAEWWLVKLWPHFRVARFNDLGNGFTAHCVTR